MNCPTCGAPNDVDARFCAECGTPLDKQDIDATISGQIIEPFDNDATIMSRPEDLLALEKTLAVGQAQIADVLKEITPETPPVLAEEKPSPLPRLPEAVAPPDVPAATHDAKSTPPAAGGRSKKTLWMIIGGIVVLLALLCCCCSVAIGGVLGDPSIQDSIMEGLGALSLPALFV